MLNNKMIGITNSRGRKSATTYQTAVSNGGHLMLLLGSKHPHGHAYVGKQFGKGVQLSLHTSLQLALSDWEYTSACEHPMIYVRRMTVPTAVLSENETLEGYNIFIVLAMRYV